MSDSASATPLKFYRRGLITSVRENSAAYGFSVTLTVAFGALNRAQGTPSTFELLLFGLGAVLGFVIVEALVVRELDRLEGGESTQVVALSTFMSVLSVGCGIGAASLMGKLFDDALAWLLGSLLATLVYVLLAGLELMLAEWIERCRR